MSQQKKIVVALHGAGMHAGAWGSLAAGLAAPCQAISFPGHGMTEGALLPSIEKMAEWVSARLDGHPAQSVVLTGHSMGALAALEAARHPSVAGIVLLGAAARMPVHPELLRQAGEDPDTAIDMILKWGVSPVHPQAAVVRTVLKEQMRQSAAGVLFNDLKACDIYLRGADAAKEISIPALVVAGLDDRLTRSSDGKALADLIEGAEFHVMPACGHMPMMENPVELAKEIGVFMENLGG